MAITLPIVSEFVDKGVKSAEAAFKNFKTQVGNAEGAMGKFKAGSKAAMDFVETNAAAFATAAAGSLIKFATDGVDAFQRTALAAGEFSAATGFAVDDASRLMEVAGDLGVDIGAVESSAGRLLRTISTDKGTLEALGGEALYTSEGTIKANEAFLAAIDYLNKIKDPAQKAKEGIRLLGKGWQSVAPLIEQGASQLRDRLKEVSDQKIITPEELEKARQFRDAMDDLKDVGEDLAIVVGEELVPYLTDMAEAIKRITDLQDNFFVRAARAGWSAVRGDVQGLQKALKSGTGGGNDLESALQATYEGYYQSRIAAEEMGKVLEDQTETVLPDVTYAWDTFLGQLTRQDAFDEAKRQVDELNEAIVAAFNGEEINAEQIDKAVRDAQRAIGDLVATMLAAKEITGAEANAILFNVKAGQLEYATKLLQNPALMQDPANMALAPGQTYIPGIGTFGTNSTISGQSATNVTINMPAGSSGDDVVRAMQRWQRDNGSIPVSTTTTIQR